MKRPARPGWWVGLVLCSAILAWSLHGAAVIGSRRALRVNTPSQAPAYLSRNLVEVEAVLHVHTRASWDGAGSYEGLLAAARRAGVEAVFVSEHNSTAAWDHAGYHQGVLLVPGDEVSLPGGHELAWGVPRAALDAVHPLPDSARGAALDALVREAGGVAIAGHPRGSRKPWKGPLSPAVGGVEIVNGDTEWRDDSVPDLVRALVFYPFDPRAALASLVDAPVAALAWWDSLGATRPVFGVAGLDAHGGIRLGARSSVPFPSYQALMRLVRQHLLVRGPLSADAPTATSAVLDALAAGRHFAAFDGFGSARGFAFWGVSGERTVVPGDTMSLSPGAGLHARIPQAPPVMVRLVRAGRVVAESRSWEAEFPLVEAGSYRLEVYQRRSGPFGEVLLLPWIFSNPIRVLAN